MPRLAKLLITAVLVLATTYEHLCTAAETQGVSSDTWLDDWIQRTKKWQQSLSSAKQGCSLISQSCHVLKYIPARRTATTIQLIPRRIWQTWTSNRVGKKQFKAMMSWIKKNPSYEYILFDDADMEEYMCTIASPLESAAYQLLNAGAGKADIWRTSVLSKYGGVYVDTDTMCKTPLDGFIWHNASMVTGIGAMNDVHQWAMMYTAHHPVLLAAAPMMSNAVINTYLRGSAAPVIDLTGPGMLQKAVDSVLHAHQCSIDFSARPHDAVTGSSCAGIPGVMQIFWSDYFGGNVIFKADDVDDEKASLGHVRYNQLDQDHAKLFNHSITMTKDTKGQLYWGACKASPLVSYLHKDVVSGSSPV